MTRIRPAVGAAAVLSAVLLSLAAMQLVAFAGAHDRARSFAAWNLDVAAFAFEMAVPLAFGAVGVLLVALRPRHPVGWLFAVAAVLFALGGYFPGIPWREGGLLDELFVLDWGWKRLVVFDQAVDIRLPFMWGGVANLAGWTIIVGALVLLFPTGRLPSRWWAALAVPVVVLGMLTAVSHVPYDLPGPEWPFAWMRYRLEVAGNRVGLDDAAWVIAGVLAALVVVLRYRSSALEERLQLKWFVAGATLLAVVTAGWVALHLAGAPFDSPTWKAGASIAFGVALLLLPLATAAAVFRYRLYDIELVLERSLVFGASALFLAGGYVVAVVAAGQAFGTRAGGNTSASALAMTVTAVAFQPARTALERGARVLVYGRRADPYAVLARLASDVADVLLPDQVMPSLAAATVAVAGGAAQVRLDLDGGETVTHTSTDATSWTRLAGEGSSLAVPVTGSQGPIGAIEVRTTRGRPLTDDDRARMEQLAAEAGLALEHVRLVEGLQRRLTTIRAQADELAASQERLLGAETWARLSIARELRDVLDFRLAAAADAIDRAQTMVTEGPESAVSLLMSAADDASQALEETREVARGVFPAVLNEAGLLAALKARIRHSEWAVQVDAGTLGDHRFDPAVESALYFCASESLRDLVRSGTPATLRMEIADGAIDVAATGSDTGSFSLPPAVLQQMADRMGAVGGSVEAHQGSHVRPMVRASAPARPVPEQQKAG